MTLNTTAAVCTPQVLGDLHHLDKNKKPQLHMFPNGATSLFEHTLYVTSLENEAQKAKIR